MARPSKLSPELRDKVAGLIRAGNTVEVAADAAGIGESTFYDWMARGSKAGKAEAPFREFREVVERAQGEAEAVLVTRIAKAAQDGSWSAAAWLLERRNPERWAKVSERRVAKAPEADDSTDDDWGSIYGGDGNVTPIRRRSEKGG